MHIIIPKCKRMRIKLCKLALTSKRKTHIHKITKTTD
jgi:hypothetical protein